MKKIFIIILCVQAFNAFSQTNVSLRDIEMRDDSLLYYKDGIFTGQYQCHKVKLTEIGYVTRGIMDSLFLFDNNGDLIQQIFYKNKTEYSVILYHTGIFTKFIQTFKNNKLDGLWEELTFDEKLLTRRYYKEGEPVGHWVTYNRKGNLMRETYFDENLIIFKEYYKKLFKKNKDILFVNVQYYDKRNKLLKKEKITINKEEYLKLCR